MAFRRLRLKKCFSNKIEFLEINHIGIGKDLYGLILIHRNRILV